jgi:hypothetical protein
MKYILISILRKQILCFLTIMYFLIVDGLPRVGRVTLGGREIRTVTFFTFMAQLVHHDTPASWTLHWYASFYCVWKLCHHHVCKLTCGRHNFYFQRYNVQVCYLSAIQTLAWNYLWISPCSAHNPLIELESTSECRNKFVTDSMF